MEREQSKNLDVSLMLAFTSIQTMGIEYEVTKQEMMNYIFEFYDSLDRVDLKEVSKRLSKLEKARLDRKIRGMLKDDVPGHWKNTLSTVSKQSTVSRKSALKIYLYHELYRLGEIEKTEIERVSYEIYKESRDKQLYDLCLLIGVTTLFSRTNKNELMKILDLGWSPDKLNYKQRINNHVNKAIEDIDLVIEKAIKTAQRPVDTISQVSKRVDVMKSKADRLITTDGTYAHELGVMRGYDEFGLESYQNVATLDERTSDICRDMNLSVFYVKDAEVGVNAPPFHAYCRTITVPIESGEVEQGASRWGNSPIYKLDKDTSFEEWRRKRIVN